MMACRLPKPRGMFTTVTVTRTSAGSYVDGRWVAGDDETLSVVASIQPAKPDELRHLPEGDRTREAVKIYTDSLLRVADESQGLVADRLTWDSEEWEVQEVSNHVLGLAHYKGLALRVER